LHERTYAVESKSVITLGNEVTENQFERKSDGRKQLRYLFEWNSYFARAAYELMQNGYRLKVARNPLKKAAIDFVRKILLRTPIEAAKGGSEESAMLKMLAEREGPTFYAINTGLTSGSDRMSSLWYFEMPKPLMLVGSGVKYRCRRNLAFH
jgi:hypothetical protein